MSIQETIAQKLATIAANSPRVYAAGEANGINAFFDDYLQNGTRTNFVGAFSGKGWTNTAFKPNHNITAIGNASYMFYTSAISGDLVQILQDLGITLSTTGVTNATQLFGSATAITRLGVIDISSATNTTGAFAFLTDLETIDEIITSATTSYVSNTFASLPNLKNITFTGVIATNITLASPLLTAASLTSTVNALSATATGKTATFSTAAVNKAFETSAGANDGKTSAAWTALVGTKPNWSIAYA